MTTTIPYPYLNMTDRSTTTYVSRKRKAELQENNERLSKRLSLLNLERCRHSLHTPTTDYHQISNPPASRVTPVAPEVSKSLLSNDMMQVDDSKHKVFIYDLDAELSDLEPENKLILLPDIEKHLRETRIPRPILENKNVENNQIVLYRVPDSLTVSEDQDSVRRAFIETRARAQAKQMEMMREIQLPLSVKNEDVVIQNRLHVADYTSVVTNPNQDPDGMDIDVFI